MPPVVSALLACLIAWCRSRRSIQMEIIALRHQGTVSKQTILGHASVRRIACSGPGSRVCGPAGKMLWSLPNRVPSLLGGRSCSAITGDGSVSTGNPVDPPSRVPS